MLPLVHERSSIPVDVVLAGPGLERLILECVRYVPIARVRIPVVSPEDLLVLKILAGRPQDLADVEAVLRGGERIDLAQTRETLRMLEVALGQSDLTPRLEESVRAVDRGVAATRRGGGKGRTRKR